MAQPRARKRISQACVPCGKKKSKCDGGVPSCGRCRLDRILCVYGTSKRNRQQKQVQQPVVPVSATRREASIWPAASALAAPVTPEEYGRSHSPPEPVKSPALNDSSAQRAHSTKELAVISHEVSTRLFKAFFATIHPIWPILYKPLYDLDEYRLLTDKLPPPLLYAIYSIAACVEPQHHQEQESRANAVPEAALLFEAALLALQRVGRDGENSFHPLNLLKPSIETCQALTILALEQHGVAESTCAILLCGLASAMAVELRLYVAPSAGTDPIQAQVSSRLWWNLFVLDKMLSCEIGRPVVLRSEETDNPFPSTTESDEYQLITLSPSYTASLSSVKTQALSGFKTTIQIALIMEKVSRQIYALSARAAICNNLRAGEEIRMRLWKDLQNYHAMLEASPLKLGMERGTIAAPVTITNMVWMWLTAILLHRPFISYWDTQGRPSLDASQSIAEPLDICVMAANNICSILERHAENLSRASCDLIFPIFTAASTLSRYSKRFGIDGTETQIRINLCVRWLLILGKSWKNAGISQQKISQGEIQATDSLEFPVPTRPADNSHGDLRILPQKATTDHSTTNHMLRHIPSDPVTNGNVSISSTMALSGYQSLTGLEESPITNDDWSFLSNLGNLYSMDPDFQGVLEGCLSFQSV